MIVVTLVSHLEVPDAEVRRPRGRRGDGRVDQRPPKPHGLQG